MADLASVEAKIPTMNTEYDPAKDLGLRPYVPG